MVQIRGGGAFECRGVGHGGAAAAAQAAAKAAAAAAEAASSLQTLHSQHEGANDFYGSLCRIGGSGNRCSGKTNIWLCFEKTNW